MRTMLPRHWWTAAMAAIFLTTAGTPALAAVSSGVPALTTEPKIVYAEMRTAGEEVVTQGIALDEAAPKVKLSIEDGSEFTTDHGVKVDIPCNDDATGCKAMRMSKDGGKKFYEWTTYEKKRDIELPYGDGKKKIAVEVMDGAGNKSKVSTEIFVDTTPPRVAKTGPWGWVTRSKPTVKALVRDWGTGLDTKKTTIKLNGKTLPSKVSEKGVFDYRLKGLKKGKNCVSINAEDRAGHKAKSGWCFEAKAPIKSYGRYFTNRKTKGKPWLVVMHSTAGKFPGDYNTLRGKTGRKVSVHAYIRKNGQIYTIIPDWLAAYHAGKSSWGGINYGGSLNSVSLGIELENLNNGKDPYTQEQIQAAAEVTKRWQKLYNIPNRNVTSHAAIAGGRKSDPLYFPWKRFWAEHKTS